MHFDKLYTSHIIPHSDFENWSNLFTEEFNHRKQSVLNDAWQSASQIITAPSSSLMHWEVSDYLIEELKEALEESSSFILRMDISFERASPKVYMRGMNQ